MKRVSTALAAAAVAAAFALPSAAADHEPAGDAIETLRGWSDVRRGDDGRLRPVHVELAFDYAAGTAIERVRATDGTLLSERATDRIPSATDAEIARAKAILEDDHEFARLILERDVILDGGFVLTEADENATCAAGTRCIQIFGFARHDAQKALFCAVVDLTGADGGEIAYRDYWDIRPEVER